MARSGGESQEFILEVMADESQVCSTAGSQRISATLPWREEKEKSQQKKTEEGKLTN